MYLGPAIAVAHLLVPASMRALTSAILFLVLNLIGLGFGPLVVGIISDLLAPTLGVESPVGYVVYCNSECVWGHFVL